MNIYLVIYSNQNQNSMIYLKNFFGRYLAEQLPGIVVIAVVFVLFNACAPAYIPGSVNTPLLRGKGEYNIGGNVGFNGVDVQLSASVSEHIGLMVATSYSDRDNDSSDTYHRHLYGDVGVGYFNRFTDNFMYEVYGGAGMGHIESYWQGTDILEGLEYHTRADMKRIFVQPAVGFIHDAIDVSFATKFMLMNLELKDKTYNDFYVEPAVSLKAGYKFVRFVGQIGFSVPMQEEIMYEYKPWIVNMGLQFTLGRK